MNITGLILSIVIIALATRLLIKKYNAQAVLLISGLLMLGLSLWVTDAPLSIKKTTGFTGFDFFKLIKESFVETNAGVGLMIMSIGGFVAYIDKIGASSALVHVAMKPLSLFKAQPYLAASLVIPIGQILFIAIPSAAGLSLLLMASLFPLLTKLGVSRLSAAAVITSTTAFCLGPASAIVTSASNIIGIESVNYFVDYQIFLVIPLSLSMMVSYYFVNKYYDKKENHQHQEEVNTENEAKAPAIYAIIPLLPILLLLVFSELFSLFPTPITLDTTTAMFISLFVALLFEFIRKKKLQEVFDSLKIFWNGMGNIFKTVVTLIIAADIFAQGLISLEFIDNLIQLSQNLGLNATGIGIVMTVLIFLAAMLMGSGNAAFFAFGPLVPNIATKLGVSSTSMILPMQFSASMGRTVSPVSGVLIAVSELAGVSPVQLVKRNIIPLSVSLVSMLLYHFI
jgi:C4-dicarboxylate transporter, DcuC family